MSVFPPVRLLTSTALGILLLLFLSSLQVPQTSASLSSPSGPRQNATFDTLHRMNRYVFQYTNEVRRKRAQSTLQYDSTLADVACTHSADMYRRDFFQHVNPDGERPHDRVGQLHRRLYGQVGENLYQQIDIRRGEQAIAREMIDQWMNSLPHRKNLLRPPFTHVGVCALRKADTLLATQVFAEVSAYLSSPLPQTVDAGRTLPISIAQTFPPDARAVRYDFWDATRDRIVAGPHVMHDSLRIPDTTGTVWSRFYVLETGRYRIQRGPQLTITSP